MNEKVIEVKGLHKFYGNIHAVKGIDFYVEKGKVFAFLGPNGAGKSTTIDIICTFLKQNEGEVWVYGNKLGEKDDEIRSIIGAVFQDGLLDGLLTIEENLQTRGAFYGLKGSKLKEAINRVAEITGIKDLLKRKYKNLSGGQRRRCDIARALINTPKILFLDEPTTGLDPQTRKMIWETISELQKKTKMTIFLTTHYMEEAANADYVIVIDDGLIAAKGTPAELKEKYSFDKLILSSKNIEKIESILANDAIEYERIADQVIVKIGNTLESLEILNKCRSELSGFEVIRGTMDDAFIGITGKEIRE
ncbi:MAG TPA: ABC transporter ATP-binding protein [Bacilli bacterium]|nr:ABC transporter ATP-binding protein [Bacilli bacterium]NLT01216.1 ABC transporter ATP-binding protein [Acholeplasmataceae bacterium]HNZ77801.1 ABC transporter ATP-binding protein [Bacilli bacterium]HOD60930.1 ABC transporter ATP-binding protein [Bacilli bacterium]HOE07131.1 ABC transporter ATP-binding protein [Bacilli bacterium]